MSVKVVNKVDKMHSLVVNMQQEADREMQQIGQEIYAEAYSLTAVDAGEERDSLRVEVDGNSVNVGYDSDHAKYDQLGTRYHAPQPALAPAFDHQTADLPARMGKAVDRAASGRGGR